MSRFINYLPEDSVIKMASHDPEYQVRALAIRDLIASEESLMKVIEQTNYNDAKSYAIKYINSTENINKIFEQQDSVGEYHILYDLLKRDNFVISNEKLLEIHGKLPKGIRSFKVKRKVKERIIKRFNNDDSIMKKLFTNETLGYFKVYILGKVKNDEKYIKRRMISNIKKCNFYESNEKNAVKKLINNINDKDFLMGLVEKFDNNPPKAIANDYNYHLNKFIRIKYKEDNMDFIKKQFDIGYVDERQVGHYRSTKDKYPKLDYDFLEAFDQKYIRTFFRKSLINLMDSNEYYRTEFFYKGASLTIPFIKDIDFLAKIYKEHNMGDEKIQRSRNLYRSFYYHNKDQSSVIREMWKKFKHGHQEILVNEFLKTDKEIHNRWSNAYFLYEECLDANHRTIVKLME